MRTYSNTTFPTLVLAVIMLFITGGCEDYYEVVKKQHTAETKAKVTSTKGTGCGRSGTKVQFEYSVNGKVLEELTCYSDGEAKEQGLVENAQATACYDPSNPEDAVVIPSGYRCGK